MCKEGYKDKDCIKECGKGRFDCIYWQDDKVSDQDILIKEQEQLYAELTATFDDKRQFKLLNELIETELELEKYCDM